MRPGLEVILRPVVAADRDFLLRVYASTRAGELALTGWDAATCDAFVQMQFKAQNSHYLQYWPASEHAVIEVLTSAGTQAVGRLWVDRRSAEIHVLDIVVLPEWAGRGIGTHLLRWLMDEARTSQRLVSIFVELGNPARRLYDRLGFQPSGPQQGLYLPMAWRPAIAVRSTHEKACDEQA